jgi:hypothetical protein
MKRVAFLCQVMLCATAFAQSSHCSKNSDDTYQCSTTIGDHTYSCTSYTGGSIFCSSSDPAADAYYREWRKKKLDKYIHDGMTQAEAEQALHDEIMAEDEGELKARHELCDQGKLEADRCDFSKPHPVGYRVPRKVYQEGTPQELAEAVKAGRASNCLIYAYPKGVEVSVDGVKVGVDPLPAFILLKRDKPRKITFSLAGYKTVEKQVDPDGNLITLGVKLEKN